MSVADKLRLLEERARNERLKIALERERVRHRDQLTKDRLNERLLKLYAEINEPSPAAAAEADRHHPEPEAYRSYARGEFGARSEKGFVERALLSLRKKSVPVLAMVAGAATAGAVAAAIGHTFLQHAQQDIDVRYAPHPVAQMSEVEQKAYLGPYANEIVAQARASGIQLMLSPYVKPPEGSKPTVFFEALGVNPRPLNDMAESYAFSPDKAVVPSCIIGSTAGTHGKRQVDVEHSAKDMVLGDRFAAGRVKQDSFLRTSVSVHEFAHCDDFHTDRWGKTRADILHVEVPEGADAKTREQYRSYLSELQADLVAGMQAIQAGHAMHILYMADMRAAGLATRRDVGHYTTIALDGLYRQHRAGELEALSQGWYQKTFDALDIHQLGEIANAMRLNPDIRMGYREFSTLTIQASQSKSQQISQLSQAQLESYAKHYGLSVQELTPQTLNLHRLRALVGLADLAPREALDGRVKGGMLLAGADAKRSSSDLLDWAKSRYQPAPAAPLPVVEKPDTTLDEDDQDEDSRGPTMG